MQQVMDKSLRDWSAIFLLGLELLCAEKGFTHPILNSAVPKLQSLLGVTFLAWCASKNQIPLPKTGDGAY